MIIMAFKEKFSVIGIGYVGLPLAIELSKSNDVLGFDINQNRIEELEKNNDSTLEIKKEKISLMMCVANADADVVG